jgi:hypothetical protein
VKIYQERSLLTRELLNQGNLYPRVNAGGFPELTTVDGPLGWHRPLSGAGFTAMGMPAPSQLLLCQQASGALVATTGTNMAADGAGLRYQQTVTGWTSKWVGLASNTANNGWRHTTAQGVQPGTNSVAMLMYLTFGSAPAANRNIGDVAHDSLYSYMNTNGKLTARSSSGAQAGTSAQSYAGRTTPYLIVVNRTASSINIYTDLETWTVPWFSVANGYKGLHSTGSVAMDVMTNLIAHWSGTDAEGLGKSTIESLIRARVPY